MTLSQAATAPVTVDYATADETAHAGTGYTLSLAAYTQPGHGSVAENSNSSLTYTPAAGYLGTDSFTYTSVSALTAA